MKMLKNNLASLEATFHKLIRDLLSRRAQGIVMGAFRKVITEAQEPAHEKIPVGSSVEERGQQVIDCFAAERQALREAETAKETTVWIIERTNSSTPFWITLKSNYDYAYYNELWTFDAARALRFGDKQSADDYIRYKGLLQLAHSTSRVLTP